MKITNKHIINNITANTGRFFITLDSVSKSKDSNLVRAVMNENTLCCGYDLLHKDTRHIDAIPLENFAKGENQGLTLLSHGFALEVEGKLLLGKRPSHIVLPHKWTIMGGRCSELPSLTGIKETLEEIVIEVSNGIEYGFLYLGELENPYHLALAETSINEIPYVERARATTWVNAELEDIVVGNERTLEIENGNGKIIDTVDNCHLVVSNKWNTIDIVKKKKVIIPEGWHYTRSWFIENDETFESSLRTKEEWRTIEDKITPFARPSLI